MLSFLQTMIFLLKLKKLKCVLSKQTLMQEKSRKETQVFVAFYKIAT